MFTMQWTTTHHLYRVIAVVLLFHANLTSAGPERGKWQSVVDRNHTVMWYVKSLYAGGHISVSVTCDSDTDTLVDITWLLRRSPCAQEYIGVNDDYALEYVKHPSYLPTAYTRTEFMTKTIEKVRCHKGRHFFFHPINVTKEGGPTVTSSTRVVEKRSYSDEVSSSANDEQAASGQKENLEDVDNDFSGEEFLQVWADGYYILVLRFSESGKVDEKTGGGSLPDDFRAEVEVRMMWSLNNYISSGDYHLLVFYGVMALVYISLGLAWLLLLACNWQDLLRVQFWVGGVIFLGMLEKAVFFAEYENVNKTGQPVRAAIIAAELVSCLKRGVSRMLLVVVCLGFGVTKSRLGETLHKVMHAGGVFVTVAFIESFTRATKERTDQSTEWMLAAVPLAVTDVVICWWAFSALLQTTRTLALKRNVVKLQLYRHFTNTLVFAILASGLYLAWFLSQHRFNNCIHGFLWVDEAFWHVLFSIILAIIMVLWRPNAETKKIYNAFSPRVRSSSKSGGNASDDDYDDDDDDDNQQIYGGVKVRSTNAASRKGGHSSSKAEANAEAGNKDVDEDLKWIEDNIPSSLADALDDNMFIDPKTEVSKME